MLQLVYGCAGVAPLKRSVLNTLHSYTGAEVGFYFAWVSAYTRSLWFPSLFGGALWALDIYHFDAAIADERNATWHAEMEGGAAALEGSATVSPGYQRAILQMLFGLCVVVWSSSFDETWKRRQALVASAWGELGAAKPPDQINPNFRASQVKPSFQPLSRSHRPGSSLAPPLPPHLCSPRALLVSSTRLCVQVKPGFYTEAGLWVSLEERKKRGFGRSKGGSKEGSSKGKRSDDGGSSGEAVAAEEASAASALLGRDESMVAGEAAALSTLGPTKPKDVYFSTLERMKRQYTSAIVTLLMTAGCVTCIFFMQLFAAFMDKQDISCGGGSIKPHLLTFAAADGQCFDP